MDNCTLPSMLKRAAKVDVEVKWQPPLFFNFLSRPVPLWRFYLRQSASNGNPDFTRPGGASSEQRREKGRPRATRAVSSSLSLGIDLRITHTPSQNAWLHLFISLLPVCFSLGCDSSPLHATLSASPIAGLLIHSFHDGICCDVACHEAVA